MSGPFHCCTCDGTGYVITGWDAAGEETDRPCYECNGTGETWFFLSDPNRPKGWPGEGPAFNLTQTIRKALRAMPGRPENKDKF